MAANFLFNDTHRQIIFQVMQAYYRLLDTKGLLRSGRSEPEECADSTASL